MTLLYYSFFGFVLLLWLVSSLFLTAAILSTEPKGGGAGGLFGQEASFAGRLGISTMPSQVQLLTRNAAVLFFLTSVILGFYQ